MIGLYIDPGTGSMLFSVVIGLVTMLYFLGKAAYLKLKFVVSGGKAIVDKTRHPFVVYSEGERYWNVFKPILDTFEEKKIKVVFYTSSENDSVFKQGYTYVIPEYIGKGNKAFTRLNFLEADICLMTTPSLDIYQLKRSRGVTHYSHILHAVDDATSYRLFGLDYFDSVLLTGEYQKHHLRMLEEKRGTPKKELEVVGSTYLDVLQLKINNIVVEKNPPFTVLVAPSWGGSGILSKYGESLLDPLIKTGFHIVVRPHPQSKQTESEMLERLQNRYQEMRNLEWDFEKENLVALSRANIMISDFSGVIFDYTFLFDRPFLYVNAEFDHLPYDSYDIEETPWKFKVIKEIGVELNPDNFSSIKSTLISVSKDEVLSVNRQKAKETAWQFRGLSGKKVVSYLTHKQKDITEMT